MSYAHLSFRKHALEQMFKRNIGEDDVRFVLEHGEIIIEYFDDTPYPSRLLLAWRKSRPLHVVAADNPDDQVTIIITAYEPDPSLWEADFKRKKRL